eukprot:jgi/Botrbrau1/20849/Bobra.0156s0074.1
MGFKRHREVTCVGGNWPLQVTQQKLIIPISVRCGLEVPYGNLMGGKRCVCAKGRGCDHVGARVSSQPGGVALTERGSGL